jgi:hypothetical protein
MLWFSEEMVCVENQWAYAMILFHKVIISLNDIFLSITKDIIACAQLNQTLILEIQISLSLIKFKSIFLILFHLKMDQCSSQLVKGLGVEFQKTLCEMQACS